MKHERSVLKGDPRDTTEWSGHHRGSADGSMKEEAVFSGLEKYEEYARLGRWIIGIVHMKLCKHGHGDVITRRL